MTSGFWQPNYDLALRKQLDDGSNKAEVSAGDTVTFNIEIINQGNVTATNIGVVDYTPTGLTLADSAWTDNGDGTATLNTPIASLAAGASTTVTISFTVDVDAAAGDANNWAEITGGTPVDPDGNPIPDLVDSDSTPDTDKTNDNQPEGPNQPGDDATDNTNGDEDDHDIAGITIKAAVGSGGQGRLPVTGGNITNTLAIALTLLAAGGAMLTTRRRRQQQ